MVSSENLQELIAFLINVGTLAGNELKERWTLKRKERVKNVDLSKKDLSEEEVSEAVQDFLISLKDDDVKQTLELMRRKQKLIYVARRGKLNDEEEYYQGRATLTELELRRDSYDTQIKEKISEIESDFQSLGIHFEKKALGS